MKKGFNFTKSDLNSSFQAEDELMQYKTKQLQILCQSEIAEIYGQPQFTQEDRLRFFFLTPQEETATVSLHSIKSRALFILQLGYFKVRRYFCTLYLEKSANDLLYIMQQYFPTYDNRNFSALDQRTRLKHQQMILELCRFRELDEMDRMTLAERAKQAARISSKPVYVFRILMEQLAGMRVVLPSYRYMQDTVSAALSYERKRLVSLLEQHLTIQHIASLKALIADTEQFHAITQLCREPKDYGYMQMREEIQRRKDMAPLYAVAARILPLLEVSRESIKHYASLVSYYTVFRLKRLNTQDVQLYLLCFIFHRYRKANDTLIDALSYHVRQYWDSARHSAKERMYLSQKESGENIKKAGKALEVFIDESIDGTTPIAKVQERAFTILERKKLSQATQHITTGIVTLDETAYQWEYMDTVSQQFKKRIRPLVLAIDFTAASNSEALLHALNFIKTAFNKGLPLSRYTAQQFPMQCVKQQSRRYLVERAKGDRKQVIPDRYEFQLYRLLRDNLEAGNISCRDSVQHRSLEEDLVSEEIWEKDKEKLIAESGSTVLQQPIETHLAELLTLLETKITRINARIAARENEHFKVTKRGKQNRWTLQYPRESDPVNHAFYDTLPQTDISRVLYFVHKQCGFMDEFEHILGRYTKKDADERLITACQIAWGTNMGLGKMGAISNISYELLSTASENFLRLETLRAANDRISNATAKLSIFRHYDIGEVLHSSSDGQKIETQYHTVRSRHSSKYFGLGKGLSANTMIINNVPVNAGLLGANDHESHYVYDLIYNNSTDIQPDIHSTDTHGSNQVNFGILHIFGYQFAPRYRDICDTVTNSLYGARHPSQYGNLHLKPIRKINERLIIEEWENIQRIMVSLARKDTTQSIIVGKLSSHVRRNKTCSALCEYDNIIRSLYLLDYVDSLSLRRNVQKAVNRTESYHKLRREIAYTNGGKLRFRSEADQEIWNECSRLIANCIIHYNACILSDMLEHYESTGETENANRIKRISPIAWQHINLYGRYDFLQEPEPIDVAIIIQQAIKAGICYPETVRGVA